MATKEQIADAKKKNKGIQVTSHEMKPYAPSNIHLSKAQYLAQEKVRKENELKIKEFADNLKKETNPVAKEEKKETKRPKKIE